MLLGGNEWCWMAALVQGGCWVTEGVGGLRRVGDGLQGCGRGVPCSPAAFQKSGMFPRTSGLRSPALDFLRGLLASVATLEPLFRWYVQSRSLFFLDMPKAECVDKITGR